MPKFENLKKYHVTAGRSARLKLAELDGAPELQLLPANEANARYWTALLESRKGTIGRSRGAEALKAERDDDRRLMAEHCIVGWSGLTDDDGKDVPFSKESAREYFTALPDDIFDVVRAFAGTTSNFRNGRLDAEEAAKNS